MRAVTWFAAVIALTSAGARAAEPDVLAPDGHWEINYDKNSCQLARSFSNGGQPVIMRLTQFDPYGWFQISLLGDRFRSNGPRAAFWWDFGSNGSKREAVAMMGKAGDLHIALLGDANLADWIPPTSDPNSRMPSMSTQDRQAITSVTVAASGMKPFTLTLGPMNAPMRALDKCVDDLMTTWGYDPTVLRNLSSRAHPIGDLSSWVHKDDIPHMASILGHNSVFSLRLDVEVDGTASGCEVVETTNHGEYAAAVCNAFRMRGRFAPATDMHGQPVRSFAIVRSTLATF